MWKQYTIGGVISLIAIWFFIRMVDLNEMAAALSRINAIYLIPSCFFYLLSYVFRVARWKYLMRPVREAKFMALFKAMAIGFLANNILPAHLGEFVRAFVLGKSEGVSKSATFATIVLERIYDGLTVLFMLLMVLFFMELPEDPSSGALITASALRNAGWAGLALFGGLMVIMQLLRFQRERACKVCHLAAKPLPEALGGKLIGMVDSFCDGLAITTGRDLLFTGLHSLLTWICLSLWAWTLFPAFDLHFGPMAGVLLEVVVALALLIPSAPAFVGVFHMAATATLAFMGTGSGIAGSYAMVLWLIHVVFSTGIGLYFCWNQGFEWMSFARQKDA
jgi:uncharacterized protein (TIRG00374 family)